jgi:hypothetical protein
MILPGENKGDPNAAVFNREKPKSMQVVKNERPAEKYS